MSGTITPSQPNISQLSDTKTTSLTSGSVVGDFFQETLALTRRLFIQLKRRPSTLIAGIIQPLMWLILFEVHFGKVPQI
ncbi:MAG: ABC transporter permease, partial [Okeania sp. SIO4D6]|nr:ABC transporter permease [Okeania sp. SIO4D6]